MNSKPKPFQSPRRQCGQSMTEYAVICAGLAMLLFAATPVGQELAQAIRGFYFDLTLYLSLP